jgi:hypothetical protein
VHEFSQLLQLDIGKPRLFRDGEVGHFYRTSERIRIADITLNSTTSAIPEPSSIYWLATGLGAIGFRRYSPLLEVTTADGQPRQNGFGS